MSYKASQILDFYRRDRDAKQAVLDERITDLAFARMGQGDDSMSAICNLEFQGEYNIISRERKRIQSEFRKNDIEVKFRNKSTDDDDIDDIVQGKYRTDRRASKSRQCFQMAQDDAIDCGFGAWRLVTENEDDLDTLSTNLEVRRLAIPEAVRRVFFDCNAVLMDKSDASRCSVISEFDQDGYKKLLADNDISEDGLAFVSFDEPYQSIYERYFNKPYAYPFFSQGEKKLSILEFYALEPERQVYYLYLDTDGTGLPYTVKKDLAISQGMGEPIRKKTVTVNKCYKYLFNGIEVLKRSEVPGGHIPIIPAYGERNFVNGIENFYGIVKAAKDPQILINASLNYLASMMMFSPIPKPEFDPREIEGLEGMHQNSNDQTLAYTMRNKFYKDENSGETLNFQLPSYSQPPQVPSSVSNLIATLPGLTDSILNPGVTADALEAGASGVAIQQVREEIGLMSYIYLDHWGESMRRDGEVYSAMLSDVMDTERSIVVTNQDGTTTTKTVNEQVIDFNPEAADSGDNPFVTSLKNRVHGRRFETAFDIGPSYQSKRDSVLGNLKELYGTLDPNDPIKNIVLLNILSKQSGEGMDEINKMARYQLLSQGIHGFDPQTEDEKEFVMQIKQSQSQQSQQPDPMAIAAMAEQSKADAQMVEAQTKQYLAQTKASTDQAKVSVDMFNAETDRMNTQIDAQEAGASINNKEMDTMNKAVDAQIKQADLAAKEMESIMNVTSTIIGGVGRDL